MYCTKCGKETATGDAFCQYCGAPVRSAGSSPTIRSTMGKPPVPTPPPYNSLAYGSSRSEDGKRSRKEYQTLVHQTIRDQGKSVVFLISAILYTLAILCQLFEIDSGSASWMDIMEELDLPYDVRREIRNMSSDGILLTTILSMLPQFLTVLSLWLIYGGSFSRDGHGSSGAGLIILKVLEIIRIVVISLAGVLIFIVMVPSCSAVSEYGSDGATMSVLIVFSVIIGVVVMMLVLSSKTLNIYNTIRRSMEIGSPNSDLSGFVAVMTMIFGTVNVLSVAFTFSWYTLLLGVAQVMLGLQIFFYKSAMTELENSSHLYTSSHIGAYKTDGSIPTWKRLEMENGFGPGEDY